MITDLTFSLVVATWSGLLLVAMSGGKFQLTTTSFEDGKAIPTKYAYTGVSGAQNVSPQLKWDSPPPGTKSFALICVDRHPIASNWIHWLVVNIPSSAESLAEGASRTSKMPEGSLELKNSFGPVGWGGPQPPKGSGVHSYEFLLYALNVDKLSLSGDITLASFRHSIEGKVLGTVRLEGTYTR
ncbi:MAG: YbhB/YbcL family Raf kinase inhibitor-like protein [Terriglobia bacterium]